VSRCCPSSRRRRSQRRRASRSTACSCGRWRASRSSRRGPAPAPPAPRRRPPSSARPPVASPIHVRPCGSRALRAQPRTAHARRLPGGAVVSTFDLLTVAVAAALFVGLFAFLRLSLLGIQMRAAGEKALLAAQRGINFQLLFALSWALAALSGALAGILYANN